jgi:hypothetical protein
MVSIQLISPASGEPKIEALDLPAECSADEARR